MKTFDQYLVVRKGKYGMEIVFTTFHEADALAVCNAYNRASDYFGDYFVYVEYEVSNEHGSERA